MHPVSDPNTALPAETGRPRPNLSWMLGGRLAQVLVSFVVGVMVVRYLGPEQLGILAVALAFAGLFIPLASIGSQVVVRDLAKAPEDRDPILGSTAALAAAVGLGAYLAAVTTTLLVVSADQTKVLIAILSVPLLAAPLKALDHWFEATLGAKYLTIARIVALLIASAARIVVVLAGGGVVAFACVIVAEHFIAAGLIMAFYRRRGGRLTAWKVESRRVRQLANQSFPLLVAALAGAVYMRVDQVMLGALSTQREAGLYAAVVRLSEASYFVPVAIAASFAPGIARLRTADPARYESQVSRMLTVLAGLALLIAIPIALFAGPIISVLLGETYDGAGPVLSIHVLSLLFVFLGVGQSVWMVNESLQQIVMWRALGGAALNIGLNLLLIPSAGALGAAIATMASYAVAAWLANLIHPATRPVFWMQCRALDPRRQVQVGIAELKLLTKRG